VSDYLQNYLQVLAQNLEQTHEDFRVKEAILHSLGNLKEHLGRSLELQASIEPLLQQFVFPELSSTNPFMRARACWLYGQLGSLPNTFPEGNANSQAHLSHVLDGIYQNLTHADLPVRVEAALALNELLEHQAAIDFLRPGLEVLLRTYLKIMDDIDFDELVQALQQLVNVYHDEIAPYAVSLCQKLGEAYLRLIASKGSGDDEDTETSLTAEGLMSAISRVLKSISGQYKELYPQLEELLEKPIEVTFTDAGCSSIEDGITCLSELLYNQEQVSPRMWKFFFTIVDLYVNDRGIIDEFMFQASVPLINYMQKNPEQFRNAVFEGLGSCMDMIFSLIGKIFENSRLKECELEAICAVTLLIQMLESIQGIDSSLHNILEFFVRELGSAETPDYKCMLAQGICMCLWYNTSQTLMSLEQMGCTQSFLDLVFSLVQTQVKQDFEIKRFVIGLSSLIQKDPSELPHSVQNNQQNIMKALVFLCQKSIMVRQKQQEKAEQADEDDKAETGIYEDEENELDILSEDDDDEDDEDYDCNEEDGMDRDLYDSKLDSLDEVLFCRDILAGMEQSNQPLYQYYFYQCLDQNDQNSFA
jgi:hypothetical protein